MIPACGRLYKPHLTLQWTWPSGFAMSIKLYWAMTSARMSNSFRRMYSYLFKGIEVEVFDVHCEEFCIQSGEDAVQE